MRLIGPMPDEISKPTLKESWRHCPGNINPADLPSRGMRSTKLSISKVLWNGSDFLHLPESEWPDNQTTHILN